MWKLWCKEYLTEWENGLLTFVWWRNWVIDLKVDLKEISRHFMRISSRTQNMEYRVTIILQIHTTIHGEPVFEDQSTFAYITICHFISGCYRS